MNPTATEITTALQKLHGGLLPPLMDQGINLLKELPARQPTLAQIVFASLGQRLFQLLHTIEQTVQDQPGDGYFTSAILTRNLMETASILLILKRDKYGSSLDSFVRNAEDETTKSLNGIQKMTSSSDPTIANNAANESKILSSAVQSLALVRANAGLAPSPPKFPNMRERCEELGDVWLFMYYATYRELSQAVHMSFIKIPSTTSLALRSENQGGALLYEHCRAVNYAVEFWGVTVLDLCDKHPDKQSVSSFTNGMAQLLHESERIATGFDKLKLSHQFMY